MTDMLVMFLEFFKTGLFAVGGGMATIPFLTDMAQRYPWFTQDTISDMIAVSESTPGPIGVNMATYAGYSAFGVIGGIVSTLGLVLPSFIIILTVAGFLDRFGKSFLVNSAFYGIRPVVAALIATAGVSVVRTTLFEAFSLSPLEISPDVKAVILFAVVLFGLFKLRKIHPVFFILLAAAVGIVFKF